MILQVDATAAGLLFVLGLVASFVLLLGASNASASEESVIPFTPSAEEVREAEEAPSLLTDAEVAENLPHSDLDRSESEELLQGVFGQLIAAPSELFAGLSVEKLISPHAGIIGEGDQGDPSFLLQSTVPLGIESTDGALEPIDLGISSTLNGLRPANPLVEVALPAELGDGVQLPSSDIQLTLEGAPQDRKPSILGSSVAFYPNVEIDTDFAVTPTPTGFETFTQLRSPEAPRVQTFQMALPSGSQLVESANGGAEVVSGGGDLIAKVLPPSAVDASGDAVPVSLSVEGEALVVAVSPGESNSYPIIVDPTVEDINHWETSSARPGWGSYTTPVGSIWNTYTTPAWTCDTYCHLQVAANPNGWTYTNAQSYWNYTVPRWKEDYEATGLRPTSYVGAFTVGNMGFSGNGDWQASPKALFAVSNEKGEWQSAYMYPPNISGSYGVDMKANQTGRMASFGLFATGNSYLNAGRYINVGWAQVLLGDALAPSWGAVASPTKWVDKQPAAFDMTVSDVGLGVASIQVKNTGGAVIGTTLVKSGSSNCVGNNSLPCPRTWKGAQEGHLVNYDPSGLPQGTNNLPMVATDPVGNQTTKTLQIHVDHTAPELSLSGSLTEQASLGTTLPQYILKINAKDGTSASPQSGAAAAELKIDNVKVKEWNPGCGTENCTLASEWTITSGGMTPGKHKAEVIATDAVGIKSAAKIVEFELKKDETAPTFENLSTFYTAPSGWVEQDSYEPKVVVADPKGYGVTSVQLKIDAKVVLSATQSCVAGSCSKQFGYGQVIDMSSYEGGAHPAELIATDGAGNTRKRAWTINVDPEGHISVSEATDTLSAFEDTTVLQPVATTPEFLEPEIIEAGDNPHLIEAATGFEATGVPVEVTLGASASAGFAVEGTAGEIEVTPINQGQASSSDLAGNGAAAVSSNSSTGVDTVYRPEYNGLMLFSSIREPTSPEEYSWKVHLGSGQSLKALNSEMAVVTYQDGTEAFLISAETAKDAAGAQVPTVLTVNGAIVTLTVKHRSSQFVYPVVAQQEFETPYNAPMVIEVPTYEGPPPVEEGGEANEWIPPENAYITDAQASWFVTPNLAINDNPPFSSDAYPQVRTIYRSACGPNCGKWKLITENAAYKTNSADTTWWEGGTQVRARYTQFWGWAPFIYLNEYGCGAKGPLKVERGSGQHLTAYGKFYVSSFLGTKSNPTVKPAYEKEFGLRVWVYPNGYQEKHLTGWDGLAGYDCPFAITYN